jgi:hypothetical protein
MAKIVVYVVATARLPTFFTNMKKALTRATMDLITRIENRARMSPAISPLSIIVCS